jgi:hypothetical protein
MKWAPTSWVVGAWLAPAWTCGIQYQMLDGRVRIYPALEAGVTIKPWEG